MVKRWFLRLFASLLREAVNLNVSGTRMLLRDLGRDARK